MQPLFRALVLGIVPQPRQIPPAPFTKDALQRTYFEISDVYPYQQFQLLPAEAGAQFTNSPDDAVLLQPGLVQIRAQIDSTPEVAREQATAIARIAARRLEIPNFMALGIKIVAQVAAPGSARTFVADRLIKSAEHIAELGPGFYAGGLKYRNVDPMQPMDENLLIEPLIQDDAFLYVDYDVQRPQPSQVEQLAAWVDEAFDFLRGPVMRLLEAGE